ncbi:membrane steroid-binding protein 2 [Drosophila eugracilis]|uniref:membrane steroid-binding protein 2 n=1 Tax=Drosophila eugracilis TaxID=29029 RepID=UPI001BDAC3E0|nr:membrane steroid-binding protein 2 [Drosophila eugracilis]
MLDQFFTSKLGPNLETASRILRSPLGQALISFMLGYLATTKLSQIYNKLKLDSNKSEELVNNKDFGSEEYSEDVSKEDDIVLLTLEELTAFDGTNPDLPIYTALNGLIYDLSPGREKFISHGPYALLAGCNANKVLTIACRSMGFSPDDVIKRWEKSLKAEFNAVGYLIDADMDYIAKELYIDDADKKEQSECD